MQIGSIGQLQLTGTFLTELFRMHFQPGLMSDQCCLTNFGKIMLFRRLIFLVACLFATSAGATNLTLDELLSIKPKPNVNENGIGIFVYEGMNPMDALGPYQVFKTAGLKTFLIGKQKGDLTSNNGLVIKVDKSIDEVEKLDILLVPGGALETAAETTNPVTLEWIKKIDKTTIYTTSVCTGAWILGAAGLLEGKKATTNWYRAEEILEKYGAEFQQKRFVIDGKYITGAGVTAGFDMALKIVYKLFGRPYTQAVMLDLEYDPQPPIRGGSEKKTRPDVFAAMTEMYDYFLLWFVNSIP